MVLYSCCIWQNNNSSVFLHLNADDTALITNNHISVISKFPQLLPSVQWRVLVGQAAAQMVTLVACSPVETMAAAHSQRSEWFQVKPISHDSGSGLQIVNLSLASAEEDIYCMNFYFFFLMCAGHMLQRPRPLLPWRHNMWPGAPGLQVWRDKYTTVKEDPIHSQRQWAFFTASFTSI